MFYMLEDDSFLLPFSYVNLLIDVTCQGPSHRSLPCDRCWGDYRSHHTGSAEGKSRCLWRWCWPIRGRAAADWWDPFEAPQSRDFPLKIFEISQGCDIKTDSNVLISFFITARFAEKGWNKAHFFQNHFGGRPCRGKRRAKSSCCSVSSSTFVLLCKKCTAGLAQIFFVYLWDGLIMGQTCEFQSCMTHPQYIHIVQHSKPWFCQFCGVQKRSHIIPPGNPSFKNSNFFFWGANLNMLTDQL